MNQGYDASDIEVLTGLEPVRKRPGMYTDTARPNHLALEVIDNGVDEAIAGFATRLDVTLHKDGSLSVSDNGRGMPVDVHPEERITGVELILTRLHAGGKFSDKNYRFSGGLHGVGVSVVNALSKNLEVWIRRGGQEYNMAFAGGEKKSDLEVVGSVGKRNTGTSIRFWPDPRYFDSPKFSVPRLKHALRAKAVLCPGLAVRFEDESSGEREEWFYEDGLADYLLDALEGLARVPEEPFLGSFEGNAEAADWAAVWLPEGGEGPQESYVNLIPTSQGGTHLNGFRTGLLEALREYCEFRNLLPRGVKLAPDDVWERLSYVLSVKVTDPQFTGQTKDRLSSRECAAFVSGVTKDAFSLWLNQHPESGDRIAELAIRNAQQRLRSRKKVVRKKVVSGPALPGKLSDCSSQDAARTELFLVEGDSAGGSAKQARDREFQAVMPLRGKILNTWEVEPAEVLGSQEVHDISVAIGVDPGSHNLEGLRYGKICILADADSDGAHIGALLCALFMRHFTALVEQGHVYVAMPPLYRIDIGKEVFYALDDDEKKGTLDRIAAEKRKGRVSVQRFKGLGEMNPLQLRETTIDPATRRLVQLTTEAGDGTHQIMDMLLAKKRATDRKSWLESKGDLAEV
ncbi:MAG: DNA topoisomerase IV subunit B [Gammaproteobacteria bacterium]|nr:DNA topoisomerase IV subunit B [Gammaproteobacteria bacterium]NIP90414.1 DNA topoisomerase IV subunit B [Gammaproteobacteria bacterium]NIR25042.1 DNA topoisomerase IV subunit B [Gammaproteobacteria bacterium]NIS06743.1 DNA topoisomerase IV subunit B [Gammaproteobacteria bacterium]NIU41373.1 DNA topoisomerase IV subunit B [Gammaproteobacteria bacterium]